MEELKVKVNGGYIRATASEDPNYPGIDVEFVADDDVGENLSRPRVLFEKPIDGDLRALIWADTNDEDYSEEIIF